VGEVRELWVAEQEGRRGECGSWSEWRSEEGLGEGAVCIGEEAEEAAAAEGGSSPDRVEDSDFNLDSWEGRCSSSRPLEE
jgi:hypothetical protein